MVESTRNVIESFRKSHLLRLLLIGFLILLLQIPIAMIENLIGERTETRQQAVKEVTDKWGEMQSIIGPMMTVPYIMRWTEQGENGQSKVRTELRHANFLPEELIILGRIDSEIRYRGIFEVPVYRMTLEIKGWFSRPDFSDWGIDAKDVMWDRAQLSVQISDARAIQNQTTLKWNVHELPFLPGTGEFGGTSPGIHVALNGHLVDKRFEFSFPLALNGSVGVFFAPFARETTVKIESNWNNPSFQGKWLPNDRTITDKGFVATWSIPFLGRNYPQSWTSESNMSDAINSSRFGVNLISPVDQYRMSQRSVKYETLFLLLTFLSMWLFEVLVRLRIHSVQYLLVGAGMCLFYLLELSMSEHLGFLSAYLIASAAIVGLITTYSATVLKGASRAAILGTIVTALYGYLYVLLNNQDYALLIGSIGLFVILGLVMFLTRRIDWYNLK